MKLEIGKPVVLNYYGTIMAGELQRVSGHWCFCQDYFGKVKEGIDTLGFKYFVTLGTNENYILNYYQPKSLIEDISCVYQGAIIRNNNFTREVLGICGKVVFVSNENYYSDAQGNFTIEELRKYFYELILPDWARNYKHEDKTEDEVELTIDEIAKKFNINPE